MRLDYDCVRDLLMTLEELLGYGENLGYKYIQLRKLVEVESMHPYSLDAIAYTTQRLIEAGYLNARALEADGGIMDILYSSMTFTGHQYLDSIRSNKVWTATKDTILKSGASLTLNVITAVAQKVSLSFLGL